MKCVILVLIILVALTGNSLCLKMLRRKKLGRRKVDNAYDWKLKVVKSFLALPARNYTINEKSPIGEGSFGYVFKGLFKETEVAIKFIYIKTERIKELTKNEIWVTENAALRSKLSLPVCDKGAFKVNESLTYFMTFPFAKGDLSKELIHSFANYPSDGSSVFPVKRIETVIQMARAVMEMQTKSQIIHRDIKPSNFLRMPDGRVVIADYGLAVLNSEANARNGIAGTPGYIPGDYKKHFMMVQDFKLTAKVDVFALGVSMAEYLIPEFSKYFENNFINFMDDYGNLGADFYFAVQKVRDNFVKIFKRKLLKTEKKLLSLIFNEMIVANSKFFGLVSKRISIDKVYKKLRLIFGNLVAEIERQYTENVDYCETKSEELKSKTERFDAPQNSQPQRENDLIAVSKNQEYVRKPMRPQTLKPLQPGVRPSLQILQPKGDRDLADKSKNQKPMRPPTLQRLPEAYYKKLQNQ